MAAFLIYSILSFALFGNSLFMFGIPESFAVGTELLIIALFIVSLLTRANPGGFVLHLWYSFFFMVLITICSIIVNGSGIPRSIFSLRLLYRFYFFYLGITSLALDERQMKRTNLFVSILLLLQLPFVAIKFCHYGISELTIGAYAAKGGSLTTMLPIAVIFYIAGYYFLHKSNVRYIIIAIGFVLFSIVGKKRAVFFLYPLQFLAIYYYLYLKAKRIHLPRKVGTLLLVLTLIVFISSSILYFNDTLNPEHQVGGTVDFRYAFEYAQEYTTAERGYSGYTTGRVSTTIRAFRALWDAGFPNIIFGFGPGSTTASIFDSAKTKSSSHLLARINIGYGLTSMNRITLEYGVLGMLAYTSIVFFLFRMCLIHYKFEIDSYWRAFAAGSVGFSFSMLFFFLAYSDGAFWGDTMPALYFYAMAVVYTRLQRIHGSIVGLKVQPKAF